MHFLGHLTSSFIEYPNKISTVLFVGGCNFKCSYCHNGPLLKKEGQLIKESEVLDFLRKRRKFLDAVCITGGEVSLYNHLPSFLEKVKEIDYLIKIDTNGTNPDLLKTIISKELVDYIAMDVKAPLDKYNDLCNTSVPIDHIKDSIHILMTSGIDYEFRTTVCKELLSEEDILTIAKELKGAQKYAIQNFKDRDTVLVGKGNLTPYEADALMKIKDKISSYFNECIIRNI